MNITKIFPIASLAAAIGFSQPVQADAESVLRTYGDIAHATYSDSLTTAKSLKLAINTLVTNPTDRALKAARAAWVASRAPYQQTEAYRFGNAIVDDWEGKVNAWPLDEGLIDYVEAKSYGNSSDENRLYTANVIANPMLKLSGKMINTANISKALLSTTLHEIDSVESNVATGYHAIEFLLWGQDLNGTGPGAGNRPASDFSVATCTGGNCERRVAYSPPAAGITTLFQPAAKGQELGSSLDTGCHLGQYTEAQMT